MARNKLTVWISRRTHQSLQHGHTSTFYCHAKEPRFMKDTDPYSERDDKHWRSPSMFELCASALLKWLGRLPEGDELIEFTVKEGDTWVP